MEQYDPKPIDQHNNDDSDLQDLSTGARHLASLLREMGNAPAPDSILSVVEARLNLEHGQHFQPAFMEALTQALQDEQWQVRSTAARMIGTLGEYAPRELIMTASRDQDPRVRAALLHTTSGQVKGNQLYRVAIMALQHDEEGSVRAAAAQTLANFEGLATVKVLEKALTDNDAEVRSAAVCALKMLRERRQQGEEQARSMKHGQAPSVLHQATQVVEHMVRKWENHISREGNENGKGIAYRKIAHAPHTIKTQVFGLARGRIGPYKILQTLGSGGFAEVYRCRHVLLGTEAAVKVLHTTLLQEQIEQFVLEARIVAGLEHPNIIRVLNFDVADDIPFLVMQYAPNGTLRQRHSRGTPLPLETILSYVEQIAQALQYAHDRGIIHRDIKPENMLLGQKGEVLLGDFGIAIGSQGLSAQVTQDLMGTIPYMAPEQIQGKPTQASDQYALGIVVYEWLSGSHPFVGSKWDVAIQHLRINPPALRAKTPHIPQAVEHVVMKALAKDPNQRYESISGFARALSQAIKPVSQAKMRWRSHIIARLSGKRRFRHLMAFLILTILITLFGSIAGVILSLSYITTVIITPAHVSLVQNYTLSAVIGSANPSQRQVQARSISATAPPQSTKVQASGTGETQGTRARGTLTFFNGLNIPQTIDAGTRITNMDGVQVATNETAIVPPSDPPYLGSVTVPAHALGVGTKGNIAADSIDQSCCTDNQSITVKNLSAFSSGQDPQPYTFVRQSDIARAADLLEIPMKAQAQTLLQAQVRSNEALVNFTQCTRTVYSDHQPNDRIATFTVTVTLTCNSEAYDRENAKSIAITLLNADAAKQLGDNYILTGTITPHFLQVMPKGTQPTTIALPIQAKGTWIFQFKTATREKLARLIAGKSEKDASDLLLRQTGISRVEIQTAWWVPWIIRDTLPTNSNHISLVTKSLIDQP
jgi:serine/threonine protein kinase